MLKITKNNLENAITAVVRGCKRLDYNDECFSSSDIRISENATNELCRVISCLEDDGINLYIYVRPIYIKEGFGWNDDAYGEEYYKDFNREIPDDYERGFECRVLEKFYLSKEYPSLLVEGHEPPQKFEHYIEVRTSDARFTYQKWNVDENSIKKLMKNKIFSKASELAEEHTKGYTIESIEAIKDTYADETRDCSCFTIFYKNNDEKIYAVAQQGGFYKDLIISNDNNVIDIVPLGFSDTFRTFKPEDNREHYFDKIKNHLSDLDSLKKKIS